MHLNEVDRMEWPLYGCSSWMGSPRPMEHYLFVGTCGFVAGWIAKTSSYHPPPVPLPAPCSCGCHCICECWQGSLVWIALTALCSIGLLVFWVIQSKHFSKESAVPVVESPVKGKKGVFGQQGKVLTLTGWDGAGTSGFAELWWETGLLAHAFVAGAGFGKQLADFDTGLWHVRGGS